MGTGDGSYVFRQAQKNPQTFYIGIDSNADNMCDRSHKAAKSPKKGGLANLVYVHAAVEDLPEELNDLATELTILLPWGSLLKAAAGQDISLLKNIAKLCRVDAKLRVVLGYQAQSEPGVIKELDLPLLTPEYLDTTLKKAYREAGFEIQWRYINQEELKSLDSTWAKRLAYGKKRQFVEINAHLWHHRLSG